MVCPLLDEEKWNVLGMLCKRTIKKMQSLIPRRLELQTLRLLVVRSNQLSYGIIRLTLLYCNYITFINCMNKDAISDASDIADSMCSKNV